MKAKKLTAKIAAGLFVPIVIGISVFAGTLIETSQPQNPLLQKSDSTEVEANTGSELFIPEDSFYQTDSSNINNNSSPGCNDSSSNLPSDSETNDASEKSNDKISENKQNPDYAKFPEISDENVNLTTTVENNHSSVASDNTDKNINNLPGSQRPSSNVTTDVVYFTTTIKNGEKVSSAHYSFKIIHKQKNLKVKSLTITVNDEKQAYTNGSVLLSEGENNIRIEVTYTDKNARVFSAYKDYKIFADLGEILLSTDLTDKTVNSDKISFNANAKQNGKAVPVLVECNGTKTQASSEKYTVSLLIGENIITISAKQGEKQASKTFKITYEPIKDFSIYTSLFDQTVNNSSFSFTAYTQNGSNKSNFYIVFNGNALSVNNSKKYSVTLNKGNNKIRFKATDIVNGETVVINQTYNVKYVPLSNENTSPLIKDINVTDQMTIKGSDFTLDIAPVDYKGNRIYHNGITVILNGIEYPYSWSSEYTSYLLHLLNGSNILDIRITDSDGRYTDYSYKINCSHVSDGEPLGKITVSVDANVLGLNYLIEPTEITILQGESAAYTIIKFLEEKGFSCDYNGTPDSDFYLKRISKPKIASLAAIPQELKDIINQNGYEWTNQYDNDSIGELDYCQGSGWCFSINDKFLSYGMSDAVLKDGDIVNVRFTLIYQKDIDSTYGKTWW